MTCSKKTPQLKTQLGQCKKKEEEMQSDETAFTAKLAAEVQPKLAISRRSNIKSLFVEEKPDTFESSMQRRVRGKR